MEAVPDDLSVRLAPRKQGGPIVIWPGRTVLTSQMRQRLADRADEYWFPNGGFGDLKGYSWAINLLGDPDRYSQALEFLSQELGIKGKSVFNPPDIILRTRRDRVWKELQHIENLVAPRCERFLAPHPNRFTEVFEQYAFEYPVLIRPEGSQTGKHLIRIDSRQDWDKVHSVPLGGRYVFMTQWVDFRISENTWPKLRLSITPGKVRLRHILYGNTWMVHSMERDAETAERELEVLLKADQWEALQKLGKEIHKALPLDFFGVDIGWKSDDEFVLFEANANMTILSVRGMPQHRRADYMANLMRIEADVWGALEAVAGPLR